jgi:small-conductance mechanosensitive channel
LDTLSSWIAATTAFLPLLATLAGVFLLLAALNRYFKRRWKDNPDLQFRFQLIMLALTLAGGLAVIIALPVNDVLRGQLLGLIGILLSAAIALSSTTFIVRQLGDFSVSYRVAGLLQDVQSLISARSDLRRAVLDALHSAGIEIVSPNFMNTRTLAKEQRFVPAPGQSLRSGRVIETRAEKVAFDVAEQAASVEELRKAIELVEKELEALKQGDTPQNEALEARLEARKSWLEAELKAAEARRSSAEHKA